MSQSNQLNFVVF